MCDYTKNKLIDFAIKIKEIIKYDEMLRTATEYAEDIDGYQEMRADMGIPTNQIKLMQKEVYQDNIRSIFAGRNL